MSRRTLIGNIGEIPPRAHKLVKIGRINVAVFNVSGNFYAIKDSCPHQGDSLSRGSLDGTALTCPGHSWKFDVITDACLKDDDEMLLRMFETVVDGGKLYVME